MIINYFKNYYIDVNELDSNYKMSTGNKDLREYNFILNKEYNFNDYASLMYSVGKKYRRKINPKFFISYKYNFCTTSIDSYTGKPVKTCNIQDVCVETELNPNNFELIIDNIHGCFYGNTLGVNIWPNFKNINGSWIDTYTDINYILIHFEAE